MKIGAKKERNEKEKVNRRPPRMRFAHLCFFLVGGNNPRDVSDLMYSSLPFFCISVTFCVRRKDNFLLGFVVFQIWGKPAITAKVIN